MLNGTPNRDCYKLNTDDAYNQKEKKGGGGRGQKCHRVILFGHVTFTGPVFVSVCNLVIFEACFLPLESVITCNQQQLGLVKTGVLGYSIFA